MRGYEHSSRMILLGFLLVLTLTLSGCVGGKPLLPFSTDTPPLILTPASEAGVEDYRGRFREIYCAVRDDHGKDLPEDRPCEEALWQLDEEPEATGRPVSLEASRSNLMVLVVPGFLSDCGGGKFAAFSHSLKHLETLGYQTGSVRINGRSSSAYNAAIIGDTILELPLSEGQQLVLIGYSKGAPDVLEALVTYPEVAERTIAMVSIAGVVSGTPLADGFPQGFANFLRDLKLEGCDPGDGKGWDDMKRSVRLAWWAKHKLPSSVKFFSVAAFAPREDTSSILLSLYDQLAKVDPRNDSQVIFSDAIIPGSVLLGYVKADHWAVGTPISRNDPVFAYAMVDHSEFPREVFLEAVLRSVEEVLAAD